jgi:alpha-galactosidase/6-phospho-beta-glucosidase family protein
VPQVFDTPFREAVYKRYGGLVGNFSRHPIEFLPGFLTPDHGFGQQWGVRPIANEIDPLCGERQDQTRATLELAIHQREPIAWREDRGFHGLQLDAQGRAETGHSREIIDDLIVALEFRGDIFIHLNIANKGGIAGVADEHNVELPVDIKNGSLVRKPVHFNDAITGQIARVAEEQHLLARAHLSRDRVLLVDALSMDALVPSRDIAAKLVDEMMDYEKDYIQPWWA